MYDPPSDDDDEKVEEFYGQLGTGVVKLFWWDILSAQRDSDGYRGSTAVLVGHSVSASALSWVPTKYSRLGGTFCQCKHTEAPWLAMAIHNGRERPVGPFHLEDNYRGPSLLQSADTHHLIHSPPSWPARNTSNRSSIWSIPERFLAPTP